MQVIWREVSITGLQDYIYKSNIAISPNKVIVFQKQNKRYIYQRLSNTINVTSGR